MIKTVYYVSEDNNLFVSKESRTLYENAKKKSDNPMKYIRDEEGVLFNDLGYYIFAQEGKSIPSGDTLTVYSSGYKPTPDSILTVKDFESFEVASEYEKMAQNNSDERYSAIMEFLPAEEIKTTITKAYKDALVVKGWTLWKEQKPYVGEVLVFNKLSYGDATDHIYVDTFNGKKFNITYNTDIVAWRELPENFPISMKQFEEKFCTDRKLELNKGKLWKRYHFDEDKEIVYEEEEVSETL